MKILGLERLEIDRLPAAPGNLLTNRALPDSPVIYFVHADGIVYYIGATKSLYLRWRTHHCLIHLPKKIQQRLQISWLDVNRAALSTEIEASLIQRFRPKLNRGLQRYPRKGRWDRD